MSSLPPGSARPTSRPTGNIYLDSLLWMTPSNPFTRRNGKTTISFAFGGPGVYALLPDDETEPTLKTTSWNPRRGPSGPVTLLNGDVVKLNGLTGEQAAIAVALKMWSNVANIAFQSLASRDVLKADLKFVISDDAAMKAYWKGAEDYDLPFSEMPQAGVKTAQTGFAVFNKDYRDWTTSSLMPGSIGFGDIVHEIGHLLGLDHPWQEGETGEPAFPGAGDWDQPGRNGLNQGIFTTMSYLYGWSGEYGGAGRTEPPAGWGSQMGPMAFDIAAVQALYGANTGYRRGNDTYVLPTRNTTGTGWMCLWDAAGLDAIVAPPGAGDCTIDLRAATLVKGDPNAGGYVSWVRGVAGGFTIAHGVTIENASGAGGDDTLNGNAAANRLSGGAGNDMLSGFQGNDTLFGDDGNDILEGGDGNDWLSGGLGTDWIVGGAGQDTLVMDAASGDMCVGGTGRDVFRFSAAGAGGQAAVNRIADFTRGEDRLDFSNAAFRFTYLGAGAFTGAGRAELSATSTNGGLLLSGDIDGDGRADFRLRLDGLSALGARDMIL